MEGAGQSALTTRHEARERAREVLSAARDRLVLPDESVPPKGATFLDFEDQVEELIRAVSPTLLEQGAGLGPLLDHRPGPPTGRLKRHAPVLLPSTLAETGSGPPVARATVSETLAFTNSSFPTGVPMAFGV